MRKKIIAKDNREIIRETAIPEYGCGIEAKKKRACKNNKIKSKSAG